MKGLIIKDLYACKNNIIISLLSYIIITAFFMIMELEWICPFIITILLTTTITHTIIMDKKNGWETIEKTLPVTKKEIIKSKYILYLLILFISGLIGTLILKLISSPFSFNIDIPSITILTFSGNFILGSILIPCNFILDTDKSYLGMMASLILTIFIMIMFCFVFRDEASILIMLELFSIIMYFSSYKWLTTTKNKTN